MSPDPALLASLADPSADDCLVLGDIDDTKPDCPRTCARCGADVRLLLAGRVSCGLLGSVPAFVAATERHEHATRNAAVLLRHAGAIAAAHDKAEVEERSAREASAKDRAAARKAERDAKAADDVKLMEETGRFVKRKQAWLATEREQGRDPSPEEIDRWEMEEIRAGRVRGRSTFAATRELFARSTSRP